MPTVLAGMYAPRSAGRGISRLRDLNEPVCCMNPSLGKIRPLRPKMFFSKGKTRRAQGLFQLCVFRLGLLKDGDVRVGVFPQREEVLVLTACLCRIAGECVGAGKTKACQCSGTTVQYRATMVKDVLKLACGSAALTGRQVGLAPRIHRVRALADGKLEDKSKLQGGLKGLQPIQGPGRIVLRKVPSRINGGKPIVVDQRIERKPPFQITPELRRIVANPCVRERRLGRSVPAVRRKLDSSLRRTTGGDGVAEGRGPQNRRSALQLRHGSEDSSGPSPLVQGG